MEEHRDWSEKLRDEGAWQHVRGKIRAAWGDITDQELEQARGSLDQLVGTIKQRTGVAAEKIEQQLDEWLSEDAT